MAERPAAERTAPAAGRRAAMSHAARDHDRVRRLLLRRGGLQRRFLHFELIGDTRDARGRRHLERVAALAKVQHIGVMRVTQDAREVPLAEALAVAAEQREGLLANPLAGHGVVSGRERRDGVANESERLVAGETDAGHADRRVAGRGGRAMRCGRRARAALSPHVLDADGRRGRFDGRDRRHGRYGLDRGDRRLDARLVGRDRPDRAIRRDRGRSFRPLAAIAAASAATTAPAAGLALLAIRRGERRRCGRGRARRRRDAARRLTRGACAALFSPPVGGATSSWPFSSLVTTSSPFCAASWQNFENFEMPRFFSSNVPSISCITCLRRSERMTSPLRTMRLIDSVTSSHGSYLAAPSFSPDFTSPASAL